MRIPPLGLFLLGVMPAVLAADDSWRSQLYPADWQPGYHDSSGRFLHDFSYAGYHRGEKPLPKVEGPVIDVTQPPYAADATGGSDATAAIQAALDAAAAQGGGVVYLPAGTYRVQPPEGATEALRIRGDHVILRGAGAERTFLLNDSYLMRGKAVILVAPAKPMDWREEGAGILTTPLAQDAPNQTQHIVVESTEGFAPGDLVVLRSDLTQRFIDEHGLTGKWQPAGAASPNRTLMFCRRITGVDEGSSVITLDVPLRYPVKVADLGRLVKIPGKLIAECGLEDFAIGMKQHPGAGFEENDFVKAGTAAYDVHGAKAIIFRNAENSWARGLGSFAPVGNDPANHLISGGLAVERSRFVTVADCHFRGAQYRGGGGNGYLFNLQSQETLITGCSAEAGRHNYDFGTMACSGNVITRSLAKDGKLASDFHMFLSMANLLDQMTCDGDFLEARYYRPWGGKPPHGLTTTQSVFWNTKGLRYSAERAVLIWSQQYGDGYVIGTSGPCAKVESDDYVEGEGRGETLVPASLYQDQLRRRLGTLP